MPRPGNLKQRNKRLENAEQRKTLGKMARVDAQQAFKDALDAKGITGLKLALRLKQALNAHFIKVFYDRKQGKVIESNRYIDHATRLKAIEMIVSYFNLEPAKGIDLGGNLALRGMSDEELQAKINEYASQLGFSGTPPGKGTKGQST